MDGPGARARRSRSCGLQAAGDAAEQSGFGAGRSESDAHTGGGLCYAGCDLEQPQTQGGELRRCQRLGFWDGIAHCQHGPVGSGMQHEMHLIGERRTATGTVGGKLALVLLDQVLGLATRALEAVIEPFGAAMSEAGHHIADVETLHDRLDPRGDALLGGPRLGAVAGLGVAADGCGIFLGAAHPHIIGDRLDQAAQHVIAREAEHEVDGIAPRRNRSPQDEHNGCHHEG